MVKFYKSGNICYKVEVYDNIKVLDDFFVRITHCTKPRPSILLYAKGAREAIIATISDAVRDGQLNDNIGDYTKDLLINY